MKVQYVPKTIDETTKEVWSRFIASWILLFLKPFLCMTILGKVLGWPFGYWHTFWLVIALHTATSDMPAESPYKIKKVET